MEPILFHYEKLPPMNWVYLSSLLTMALYFKFSRIWSVRNIDLIGLLLFAPGLVLVEYGQQHANSETATYTGFIWLFAVGGLFLIRLLLDSIMVRRPLLEPNLSVGGMTFLGASLLLFLMANVVSSTPNTGGIVEVPAAEISESEMSEFEIDEPASGITKFGPRYPLLDLLPAITTQHFFGNVIHSQQDHARVISDRNWRAAAKAIAILSHLAVVAGLLFIGYRHFDNGKIGMAAAVLYLMLPYTALMTGRVDHVLPAALLVWAVAMYRLPIVSGIFLGLSIGVIYYPVFLLPLWISFYWRRGLLRFCLSVFGAVSVLAAVLVFIYYPDLNVLWAGLRQMFGIATPELANVEGFWAMPSIEPIWRIPVMTLFIVLGSSFALWPAQKNLGTLMSCTAAMMLGTQFWHAHGGGLYMAWYLPLLLLTMFRPNLEDRVALSVLRPSRRSRRLALEKSPADQAA